MLKIINVSGIFYFLSQFKRKAVTSESEESTDEQGLVKVNSAKCLNLVQIILATL